MFAGFIFDAEKERWFHPDIASFYIYENDDSEFYWEYDGCFRDTSGNFSDFIETLVDFVVYVASFV